MTIIARNHLQGIVFVCTTILAAVGHSYNVHSTQSFWQAFLDKIAIKL